jgi:hypothetical protein
MQQPGEKEMQSVDARPSDAINLAVRCKVSSHVKEKPMFSLDFCICWMHNLMCTMMPGPHICKQSHSRYRCCEAHIRV